MGKLDSIIKFTGSVGDLSFYKTQDGYIVRRKYGPSAHRIKTDPAYARTRENNAEFARAGKATGLMRSAFASLLTTMSDNRVSGRLTAQLLKVIKSDARNARGERKVMDGDTSLLEGFEFNIHSNLSKSLRAEFTASIDGPGRGASINLREFNPSKAILPPQGATHFRLSSAAAVIDFDQNTWHMNTSTSDALPLDAALLPAFHLNHNLESTGSGVVFLVLGIEFLQAVNGTFYPLQNGAHNAMAIVKVDWIRVPIRKTFGRGSDLLSSGFGLPAVALSEGMGLELRDYMFELPGSPVLANDLEEEHYRRGQFLNVIPVVSGPP